MGNSAFTASGGSGGGGATNLPDLNDVDNALVYTDGFVLQADGSQIVSAQLAHTDLTSIGTNTHAQIDTHIANTSNPHSVTAAQASAVALTGNETVAGIKTFTSIPVLPATSPTTANQATSKEYVDTIAAGLSVRNACVVATTGNITLSGTQTIDGVAVIAGDRVLVKQQSTAAENGIWVVAAGAWSRATDYDASSEVAAGSFTNVVSGTAHGNTQWVQVTPGTITVGTDAMAFTQLSAPPAYTGSDGVARTGTNFAADLSATGAITLTGDSLQVAVDGSSIERSSNALQVKASGITNTMLAGSIADSKLSTISTADKVAWTAVNKTGSTIDSLEDVNAPTPTNGHALVWNSATSKWINSAVSGGSGGTDSPMNLPRPDTRKFYAGVCYSNTMQFFGVAHTPTGTATNDNQTTTSFVKYSSVATAGQTAGSRSGTFNLHRRQHNPTYYIEFRTGASIAACRIWIGIWSTTPANVDTSSPQGFGLRFSTVAGDTTFKYITKGASAQTTTDSGVTVAANTTYKFKVVVDSDAVTAVYTIDDANEQTLTTNFPAVTTEMGFGNYVFTTEAVAKTISFSSLYGEYTGSPIGISAGAPSDASYITVGTNGTLSDERTLVGTANQVVVTDGGAGSSVVLSTPQSIATTSTPQFARLGLGTAADGTAVLNLASASNILVAGANPKKTFSIPAGSIYPRTTTGCATHAQFETTTNKNNFKVLDFDATTQEYAQVAYTMPENYDGGTITFKVVWQPASGSGGVAWSLAAVSYGDNDPLDAALGTAVVVTDTLQTAVYDHTTAESGAVTIAGTPAAGELVLFEISRVTGNGSDTLGVDARLMGIRILYGINKYGH